MPSESFPSLAVVMPAYNAAHHLPQSLGALIKVGGYDELLLVNPGSTDDTASVAESMGVEVLNLGHRGGPAEARNAGVAALKSDVVLFVDSDCVIADDVIERVKAAFADGNLATLTGSYDDDPPEKNLASLYMNLRHHYTHQQAKTENATFWAGCGAVRKSMFDEVGGFDAQRFPRPMIEDIELGQRMQKLGKTQLDPNLHATHLKRWSVFGVIHTDIFSRAIPWTNLILESNEPADDLNLRLSQRIAALFSPLAILSTVALLPLLMVNLCLALVCLIFILVSLALNGGLFRFFVKKQGLSFALAAWFFHQVHLFYSATTFVVCKLTHKNPDVGNS